MSAVLLTFVHLSDTHLSPHMSGQVGARPNPHETARRVIAQINTLPFPVDFVLLTGDVGHDPNQQADYIAAKKTLSLLKPKLHVMAGNHDRSKWLHHTVLGRVPDTYWYAFETKGVQVACLDTSVTRSHHGKLGEDQLAWLDSVVSLPSDQPLVVAMHHHPVALGAKSMDLIRLVDGDALHRVLLKARHRLRCVLFGHVHETMTLIRDGITYASTQSTWFQSRTWHGQDDFEKDVIHTPGFNVVTLMSNGDTFIRAYRAPVE